MAIQDQGLNSPVTPTVVRNTGNGGRKLLSTLALLLSTLALLGTGFTLFKILRLSHEISELKNSVSSLAAPNAIAPQQPYPTQAPNLDSNGANTAQVNPSLGTNSTAPATTPAPNMVASVPTAGSSAIQPGQFVQPAWGNDARIELLSVKRIKNSGVGEGDVVNVQMRIRRLTTDMGHAVSNSVNFNDVTARNPDNTETYYAVSKTDYATDVFALSSVKPGRSADAYVWLRITEGVKTLDIYVPEAQAFKNVPISN